jgi:type I restriction enzyme S subunit
MVELSFKQTQAERIVRIAATVLFNGIENTVKQRKPLSAVTDDAQYGYTASACMEPVGPKFVRITDLQDGRIDWEPVPYCSCDKPESYLLRKGDILFARTGATTGKTHIMNEDADAVFASYLIRVRPLDSVRAEYLYWFFQSDNYWSQVVEEKEGSAQPNVNGRKLMTMLLAVADAETQDAICRFMRAVRSRQDGATTSLPELPAYLKGQRRIVERFESLGDLQELIDSMAEEVRYLEQSLVQRHLR